MIAMSVITEKTLLRAIYLIATGFGFAALMTADSDSGILGMAVFMIIYLVWFSNSLVRLKRFFLSATVMLLFAKLLRLFSLCFDDKSKGFDKFQEIFVFSGIGWILLAACAVITGILYLIDYKKTKHHNFKSRADCSCRCIRILCCCHDRNYGLFQLY